MNVILSHVRMVANVLMVSIIIHAYVLRDLGGLYVIWISMSVCLILVKMEAHVWIRPMSTNVSVAMDIQDSHVRLILMSVTPNHAKIMVHALMLSMLLHAIVWQAGMAIFVKQTHLNAYLIHAITMPHVLID
jgi:hypothetical protein